MTESSPPNRPVRTRFAPSPTGRLHLGNARTALFNALLATKEGGVFVFRCEDTDVSRSHESFLQGQIDDLGWLGLHWAEGPDRGGARGPYRQSERLGLYAHYFERLLAEERVYPCFCSAEVLAAQRAAAMAAGRPPRYAGTCARLPGAEARGRLAAGETASLRFRVPPGRTVAFTDLVRGPQRMAADDIGDFVVRRADGRPAFFFANAVDDGLMGITDVLRGEDHLSNTPRQLLLFEALSLEPPAYGHLPLVLDLEGRPLAKRTGGASLDELRSRGVLPRAVANHLFRLGHAPATAELLDPQAMARQFDLERIGRAPAQHDPQQLGHWQRLAIQALEPDEAARWAGATEISPARWPEFWRLVQGNVQDREELLAWARDLHGAGEPGPEARAALAAAPPELFAAAATLSSEEQGTRVARELEARTGASGARLFHALRAALTGRTEGPKLVRIWSYFPAEERRRRFERADRLRRS